MERAITVMDHIFSGQQIVAHSDKDVCGNFPRSSNHDFVGTQTQNVIFHQQHNSLHNLITIP